MIPLTFRILVMALSEFCWICVFVYRIYIMYVVCYVLSFHLNHNTENQKCRQYSYEHELLHFITRAQ